MKRIADFIKANYLEPEPNKIFANYILTLLSSVLVFLISLNVGIFPSVIIAVSSFTMITYCLYKMGIIISSDNTFHTEYIKDFYHFHPTAVTVIGAGIVLVILFDLLLRRYLI